MAIKKDFTNQQIGCIIALEPTNQKRSNGSIVWKCQCLKCNSELYLSTKQLKNQVFQTCSECDKKSEIGKQYGQLIVEEYVPSSKPGRHWKCRCSCGKIIVLSTASLHCGKTNSCGCLQAKIASQQCIDMTGQVFGRWKVLERAQSVTNSRQVKWLCECSCDKHTRREVAGTELRRGTTLSCGCLRMSHGEYRIAQLLTEANINYEMEKRFDSCRFPTGIRAKFDFWVNETYLIEFDGVQHYENIDYFANNLTKNQYNDQFKNEWCQQQNIPLIRIPYTKLSSLNIQDLLLETTQFRIV